jgi:diguanylate cyclase (GGDEF)-like protein
MRTREDHVPAEGAKPASATDAEFPDPEALRSALLAQLPGTRKAQPDSPPPASPSIAALVLRAIIVPTLLAVLLLAGLVGAVLHVSSRGSDEVAIARQVKLVAVALRHGRAAVRKDQEASTNWDDAVLRVRERPLDADWIDQNLGIWFHDYYKHDETYLLDPADMPVYGMRGGRRVDPSAFEGVARLARPLMNDLRARMRRGDTPPAGAAELTLGADDLLVVRGRPAIVSVKPVVSETGEIEQAPGTEHLHVSIRYLDKSFMADLASTYGVQGAAFSWQPAGEAALAIRNNRGIPIGFVHWRPFRPGGAVAQRMIPVLVVALLMIGFGLAWLLSRILRSRLELEASRRQAQHLAFHDVLTGLPNRALFEDRINQALAATRRGGGVAVMLLDLDRFKHINDTFGHLAGDALIDDFGRRLSALVREGDLVSRLGGDEFALLLTGAPQRDEVAALCDRILAAVREPFALLGSSAYVGVSIGVVFSSEAEEDRTELLRRADIALYRAKDEGRDCYRMFEPDMDISVRLRSRVEEDLRRALDSEGQLAVHYQPQVSPSGQEIVGVEALVRWQHPTQGAVLPDQFIPIAETTGLICRLGDWVMREACLASRRWPGLKVAVNLSPVQFRSQGFFERLVAIVRETGADSRRIQLEVTEGVLLDDDETVRSALSRLRAAGFTIALDDFGTGYSSLGYLRKFEVDRIKIDRSFVQALGQAIDSTAIVSAVLSLGKAMGLAVTAEGVETEEQRGFLEDAGCDEMQGYLFAPARPAHEIDALLRANRLFDAA